MSTSSEGFVSCAQCGAMFLGMTAPPHTCVMSSAYMPAPLMGVPSPTIELRDFLAASALTGVLARNYLPGTTSEKCYEIADEMLKAREQA